MKALSKQPAGARDGRAHGETAPGIWPLVACPYADGVAGDPDVAVWAPRFAELVSPALAAELLGPQAWPFLSDDAVRHSRLRGRFRRARHRQCLRWIASAGFEVVVLKGFANAELLYRDPDARVVGDLDVLVRPGEAARLIDVLRAAGYRFVPAALPRWGFISDASLSPCLSPDGKVNLDIHVYPDCYPVRRGLDTAAMLAGGQRDGADGYTLPALEHVLLLAVSNAAKDKFGPFAVKPLADILVLLRTRGDGLDWDDVLKLVHRSRLRRPFSVCMALLCALGLPRETLPPPVRDMADRVGGPEFRRLVMAWSRLFDGPADRPGAGRALRREWLLSAEPDVAAVRAWWRLKGLLRPRRGLPET